MQPFCGLGSDDEHGKVSILLYFLETFHHLIAIHTRHLKIKQDQVIVFFAVLLTHFPWIHRRRYRIIAGLLKNIGKQQYIRLQIIYDQDFSMQN